MHRGMPKDVRDWVSGMVAKEVGGEDEGAGPVLRMRAWDLPKCTAWQEAFWTQVRANWRSDSACGESDER